MNKGHSELSVIVIVDDGENLIFDNFDFMLQVLGMTEEHPTYNDYISSVFHILLLKPMFQETTCAWSQQL